jgi:hypothetical protein
MKLSIDEDGKALIHKIDKPEVIIGRSSDADIQLSSEHVSRKHISIMQNQSEYSAKLLTANNWAICMGEEMRADKDIPFFEFGEIELPGDIKIKLILEEEKDLTSSTIKKIDLELASNKTKKKKIASNKTKATKASKTKVKEKSKLIPIVIIVLAFLLIAGYLGYI